MATNVATAKQEIPKDLDDLYAVLGVPRSASPEEIQQAYRVAAMKYHPDRTKGDEVLTKVFQAVKRAYEILMDPPSREHYDVTGKVRPSEESLKSDALTVLSQHIVNCIDALAQAKDADLSRVNPIQEVQKKLKLDLNNADENLKLLKHTIERYEAILKRLKSKKSAKVEESVVGILLLEKLDNLRDSVDQVQNIIEVHKLALQMATDYEYEVDPVNPVRSGTIRADALNPFAAAQAQIMQNLLYQQFNQR